jgi:thioredoxin 1
MSSFQIIRNVTTVLSILALTALAGQQTAKDTSIHHNTCVHNNEKNTCVHHSTNGKCVHDSNSACVHHVNAVNQKSKDTTASSKSPAVKAPEKQILFFMNPNGRPCQMQLSVINEMKDKLNGLATVTFIKTTEPGDETKFYQYGIRGLPSLIIADKNGKEIKRFSPGIQDENTILSALENK